MIRIFLESFVELLKLSSGKVITSCERESQEK